MKNKIDIILIVIFLAIIMLPQPIYWLLSGGQNEEISMTENRMLSKKPDFKLSTITDYPKRYDEYYNDHLPFRESLKNCWTYINYYLFNTTVDDRVIIGKENWLFYSAEQEIEQVQGVARYSEQKKQQLLNNLQNGIEKYKAKGIETYVYFVPNKENIYKEYLPDSIPIKNDISRAEDLIEYIQNNSNIKIIYPKEELLKAKDKYQVYRKYDTHWNKIGACIGTVALQKEIDNSFSYNLENISIENSYEKDKNDLAKFAGLEELFENTLKIKNFYPEIQYKRITEKYYEEYCSNSQNDKTIVIIGDSFREDMIEYLSKMYKRAIYIHRDNYTKEFIDEVKPDIVILEAAERYAHSTLNVDF